MYIEPSNYFPDEDLKKYKLGKYADQSRIDAIIGKPKDKNNKDKKNTPKKNG